MENYIQIVKSLTTNEETIYSNSNGLLIKSILLNNTTATDAEVSLNLDGVVFKFTIKSKDQYILSTPILTKVFKSTSIVGVNIHITGLEL